jgi:hypothetical protein
LDFLGPEFIAVHTLGIIDVVGDSVAGDAYFFKCFRVQRLRRRIIGSSVDIRKVPFS